MDIDNLFTAVQPLNSLQSPQGLDGNFQPHSEVQLLHLRQQPASRCSAAMGDSMDIDSQASPGLAGISDDCLVSILIFLDRKSLFSGLLSTSKTMRSVGYDSNKTARLDFWRAMSCAMFGSATLFTSWWLRSNVAAPRQIAVDRCFADRAAMLSEMAVFNSKGGKGNRKCNRKSARRCFGCACAGTSQWRQGPIVSSVLVTLCNACWLDLKRGTVRLSMLPASERDNSKAIAMEDAGEDGKQSDGTDDASTMRDEDGDSALVFSKAALASRNRARLKAQQREAARAQEARLPSKAQASSTWSELEVSRFEAALEEQQSSSGGSGAFGKAALLSIALSVGTKTVAQVKSRLQKHLKRRARVTQSASGSANDNSADVEMKSANSSDTADGDDGSLSSPPRILGKQKSRAEDVQQDLDSEQRATKRRRS